MLELTQWYGRLGNNLMQLMNMLSYAKAKKLKCIVACPMPGELKGLPSTFDFTEQNIASGCRVFRNQFFYPQKQLPDWDQIVVARARYAIAQEILRPHLLRNVVLQPQLPASTLVIHIRSGDTFQGNGAHGQYIPSPLAFYKHIYENGDFDRVLIVTERDRRNPCIKALQEQIPNVTVQSLDIKSDIGMLFAAQHLLIGVSSFAVTLLMCCNDNLKVLYTPGYFFEKPLLGEEAQTNFEIRKYAFENYIPMGKWRNTAEQRKLILQWNDEIKRC